VEERERNNFESHVDLIAKPLSIWELIGIYFFIIFVAVVLLEVLPFVLMGISHPVNLTRISLETSCGLTLLALRVYKPQLFSRLRFRISLRYVFIAVTTGIFAANLSWFIASLLLHDGRYTFELSNFILVVIFAPVIEELLFRGIFFEALSQRFPLPVAVVLSSIIFASFHVLFWPGMIAGLILACLYIFCRRSMSACILAHMVVNFALNGPSSALLYIHYR